MEDKIKKELDKAYKNVDGMISYADELRGITKELVDSNMPKDILDRVHKEMGVTSLSDVFSDLDSAISNVKSLRKKYSK